MATEVKNEKPAAPGTPTKEAGREPIAIKSLTFRGPESVQLPNGENARSVHAGRKDNRTPYDIELLPWIRQFRVTQLESRLKKDDKGVLVKDDKGQPITEFVVVSRFLIPESWAIADLVDP